MQSPASILCERSQSIKMTSSKTSKNDFWKDIEKLSEMNQRKLLKWQLQAREPIREFSDMKIGDHLVKKKSVGKKVLYYHHFLCIGSKGKGRPTIIHYFNTPTNAFRRMFKTLSFGSGSALGKIGTIQKITLPHKDFIGSKSELQEKGAEVERVVWPDELKRYPVEEVITRANDRTNEKYYNLAKNNCESYVMWCLCGLNISLQSTPWVLTLQEFSSGVARTLYQGWQLAPKVAAQIIEKRLPQSWLGNAANAIGIEGTEDITGLGSIFGVVFTLLFEIGNATYSVYEAKKKWNKGVLIKSREGFIKEVIDAVLLALSRSGFSIAGMFGGQCIIPIPIVGSFIGLLIGTLVGHFAGKGISEACSKCLASAVETHIKEASAKKTKKRLTGKQLQLAFQDFQTFYV